MTKSQIEIVQNAQLLAADLGAPPGEVSKNALLSVVATFISDPTADVVRLRKTLDLLEQGSGGHLKRGGGFGEQVHRVIAEVGRILAEGEWQPDELKSLFGWTARLLQVRREARTDGTRETQTQTPGRQDSRQPRPSDRDRRPPPDRSGKKPATSAAPVFRGANAKNLEVLKALSKKLSDPKEEKS
jgi:hypothetical protein